jgi:hypothetical protein
MVPAWRRTGAVDHRQAQAQSRFSLRREKRLEEVFLHFGSHSRTVIDHMNRGAALLFAGSQCDGPSAGLGIDALTIRFTSAETISLGFPRIAGGRPNSSRRKHGMPRFWAIRGLAIEMARR